MKRQDLFEYEGMGTEGVEGNIEVSEQRNSSDWNQFLETATLEEWEPMQHEVDYVNAYCETNHTTKYK